jgi:hypothetical protein
MGIYGDPASVAELLDALIERYPEKMAEKLAESLGVPVPPEAKPPPPPPPAPPPKPIEAARKLAEEREVATRREAERRRQEDERKAFDRLSAYEQVKVSRCPVYVVSGQNTWVYDDIQKAEKELRVRDWFQGRHGYIARQDSRDDPRPIAEFRNGRIVETNQARLPRTSKHPEDTTWSDRLDNVKPLLVLAGGLLLCFGWLLLEHVLHIACLPGMPPSLGGC